MSINCAHANKILELALQIEKAKEAHKEAENALENAKKTLSDLEEEFLNSVSQPKSSPVEPLVTLEQVEEPLKKPSPIKIASATAYADRGPSKRSENWYWRVKSNFTDDSFVIGRLPTQDVKMKMKSEVEKRNWPSEALKKQQEIIYTTSEALDINLKPIHPRHVSSEASFELPIVIAPSTHIFEIECDEKGVPKLDEIESALELSLEDDLKSKLKLVKKTGGSFINYKSPEEIPERGSELNGRPYRDTDNGKAYRYKSREYIAVARRFNKGIIEIERKTGESVAVWMTEDQIKWVRKKTYSNRFKKAEARRKRQEKKIAQSG
jgi:hypothetical protein